MKIYATYTPDEVHKLLADALGVPAETVRLDDNGASVHLEGSPQTLGLTGRRAYTRRERQQRRSEQAASHPQTYQERNPRDDEMYLTFEEKRTHITETYRRKARKFKLK